MSNQDTAHIRTKEVMDTTTIHLKARAGHTTETNQATKNPKVSKHILKNNEEFSLNHLRNT